MSTPGQPHAPELTVDGEAAGVIVANMLGRRAQYETVVPTLATVAIGRLVRLVEGSEGEPKVYVTEVTECALEESAYSPDKLSLNAEPDEWALPLDHERVTISGSQIDPTLSWGDSVVSQVLTVLPSDQQAGMDSQ